MPNSEQPTTPDPLRRLFQDVKSARAAGPSAELIHEGAVIGGYRLEFMLGKGGMGTVWQAEDLTLQRPVALKILAPEATVSASSRERFKREAEAGGRLNHPGIVGVSAVGEANGLHYLAQELVDGGRTVADWLDELRRQPQMPTGFFAAVAELFARVAEALHEAHQKGVVHRDLKPSNVLLTQDHEPKVADFGIARLDDSLQLTRTGDMFGTPFYMSPEQAAAKKNEIDFRTDIFSLGATLYETLTLVRPFAGETLQGVLDAIAKVDPPDPRRLRPGLPVELAAICLKALSKRPDKRYASMEAFAKDLRRFLAHEPVLAKVPTAMERGAKWCQRHPLISTLSAAGVVFAFIFAGLWVRAESAHQAEIEAHQATQDAMMLFDSMLKNADPMRMGADNQMSFAEVMAILEEFQARPLARDVRASLLLKVSAIAVNYSKLETARQLFDDCTQIRGDRPFADSVDVNWHSQKNILDLYVSTNRSDVELDFLEQAIEFERSGDMKGAISFRFNALLIAMQDPTRREEVARQIPVLKKKAFLHDHSAAKSGLLVMEGHLLTFAERREEAILCYEEAYALTCESIGPGSPQQKGEFNALVRAYSERGETDKMMGVIHHFWDAFVENYSLEHPFTGELALSLAVVCSNSGQLEDARRFLEIADESLDSEMLSKSDEEKLEILRNTLLAE